MDRFHKTACMLCGLPEADWDQLSAHYLTMQVEADRIASTAEFDPSKDLSRYKDALEQRFPTPVAENILTMAVLMSLSRRDLPFEDFARLG